MLPLSPLHGSSSQGVACIRAPSLCWPRGHARRYLWDPQTSKVFADPKGRANGWPHLVGRLTDGRLELLSQLPCVFAQLKKALSVRKSELRDLFDEARPTS